MQTSDPTQHQRMRWVPAETPSAEPNGDATQLAQGRLMTFLPAELLQSGEAIVLLQKPSPWYIMLESLRFLGAVAAISLLALWISKQGYYIGVSRKELLLLTVAVEGARLFWQFLEWLSRVYVLTDRRVIRVKGVIRVQIFEAPLPRVQHTTTTFSLRERFFGLGSIHMATAGTGSTEASWVMLANPLEVHRILVQALNRYR